MFAPQLPPEPAKNTPPTDQVNALRKAEAQVHTTLPNAKSNPIALISAIERYTEVAGTTPSASSADSFLRSLAAKLPESAPLLHAVLFRSIGALATWSSTPAAARTAYAAAEVAFSKIAGTSDEVVLKENPALVEKHLSVIKYRLQDPDARDSTAVSDTATLIDKYGLKETRTAAELRIVFAQIYLRIGLAEHARNQLLRCPPERLAALGSSRKEILTQQMVEAAYYTVSGLWDNARAIYKNIIETQSPNSRIYWQAVEQLVTTLEYTAPRHPDDGTVSYVAKILSAHQFANLAAPLAFHLSHLKFTRLCKQHPELATVDTKAVGDAVTNYALTTSARPRILFETLAGTLAESLGAEVVPYLAVRERADESREYQKRLARLRTLAAVELANQSQYDGAAKLYRSVLAAIHTGAAREKERDVLRRHVCILENLGQFEEIAECYQRLAKLPSDLDESAEIQARRSIYLAKGRALFLAGRFNDCIAAVEESELLDTNEDTPQYPGGPSRAAFPFYLYALDRVGEPQEKIFRLYRAFSQHITEPSFGRTVTANELINMVDQLLKEKGGGLLRALWPQLAV